MKKSESHAARASVRPVTQRRVLRTGTSVWAQSPGGTVPARTIETDLAADVVVVGAGISGALMAYELSRRGLDVVILDRRAPISGSTMASTSLLQFELDVPLVQLVEKMGRDAAERAWRRSVVAVAALERIVRRERIHCGFSRRRSLYLAGDLFDAPTLAREVRARHQAGIDGRYLSATQIARRFGIERDGAIESPGSAVANPVQLTAALLRIAHARGTRIFSSANVVETSNAQTEVGVQLEHGPRVFAGFAIFCTGYELPTTLPPRGHTIKSTWALAGQSRHALPEWMNTHVLWEGSDPYLYMRTSARGQLIAGGEDEDSPTAHEDRALLEPKTRAIARRVNALMPNVALDITHCWAGAFGESSTGLPRIDRLPGMPRCHSVSGFGGNGITHSVIASQVVTASILGRPDPDAELFADLFNERE